jgi:hypothetical protein
MDAPIQNHEPMKTTHLEKLLAAVRERGLYRELCGLIASYYQPLGINYQTAYWHGHVCVEPRIGRTLLLKMLGDARVNVLDLALRSRVTKVLKQGDAVTGVEIQCVSEKEKTTHVVSSRALIDATEWGDVIPLTGARYRSGNSMSDAIDPAKHIQDITWTAELQQPLMRRLTHRRNSRRQRCGKGIHEALRPASNRSGRRDPAGRLHARRHDVWDEQRHAVPLFLPAGCLDEHYFAA